MQLKAKSTYDVSQINTDINLILMFTMLVILKKIVISDVAVQCIPLTHIPSIKLRNEVQKQSSLLVTGT